MPESFDRRQFLQRAAMTGASAAGLATLGASLAPAALAQEISYTPKAKPLTPNEKLNLAWIGVGGQGGSDIGNFENENIVAVCDVDDARAADTYKKFPNAKRYSDYRELLDKEGKNLDGVGVSTPDHSHAPATMMALQMGKAVYTQKPLTHNVSEARALMEAARKLKAVTQMGNQGHPSYARLVEVVREGIVGGVKAVHVWTDRPIWPQGMDAPTGTETVPSTLHWDLWLGPAAARPYHSAYLPFVWRGWWDFGTGALGDMACHLMDGAFWSLGLKYPLSVESEGAPLKPEAAPDWMTVHYEFPARGTMPPATLTWYDGKKDGKPNRPPADLSQGVALPDNGSLFVGERGTLFVNHGQPPQLIQNGKLVDINEPMAYLPRVADHYQQWAQAIRAGGGPTGSNFDYAAPMTESILLGIVAFRAGEKLNWDAKRMRATNSRKADEFVHHQYRKGWKL